MSSSLSSTSASGPQEV
ncbi:unnamed protein product, partial [Rotaria sp. Silwood1]